MYSARRANTQSWPSPTTLLEFVRDMRELNIDLNKWEELATDRYKWKSYLQAALKVGGKYIITAFDNKRRFKKDKN